MEIRCGSSYAVRGTGTSRFRRSPRPRRFATRALFAKTKWDRGGRELCADLFMGPKLRSRRAAVIGRSGDLASPSGRRSLILAA
jgi:hypothetical protein